MDYGFLTPVLGIAIILAGVVTTAVTMLANIAIKWLKAKLGADQFEFLKSTAKTTVRYVEQASGWDSALNDGSMKKGKALLMLTQAAEAKGIPFTPEMLDQVIEEAVNVMNAETPTDPGDRGAFSGIVGEA